MALPVSGPGSHLGTDSQEKFTRLEDRAWGQDWLKAVSVWGTGSDLRLLRSVDDGVDSG